MHTNLGSNYLGLALDNPLVASAGPITDRMDLLVRLENAGIAAVVLPSLFQEQIENDELAHWKLDEFAAQSTPEAGNYFPAGLTDVTRTRDAYLSRLERVKRRLRIPVMGSLNGTSRTGWERLARDIEAAGADALELNIYLVADEVETSAEVIEGRYLDLVRAVCGAVTLPVAIKIGPYFSALPNFARGLVAAGARGLVLFNRYLQPDIDLEAMQVTPDLVLSSRWEARLSWQWIGLLHGKINASLAHSSGIHSARDVVKSLLVGADVAMLTTALLQQGVDCVRTILQELEEWMEEHDYFSAEQMRGSLSYENCPDPGGFLRVNYLRTLQSFSGRPI